MGIINSLMGLASYDVPVMSHCSNCGQRFHNYARSHEEATRMQYGVMCPQCEHASPADRAEYASNGGMMNRPLLGQLVQGGKDYFLQGERRMVTLNREPRQPQPQEKSIWQKLFGF